MGSKKVTDIKQAKKKESGFATRSGFTNGEALRLNYLLQNALARLDGKPHYWAAYLLGKIQSVVKAFNATLEKHDQFKDYAAGEKEGKPKDELDKAFPEFAAVEKELRETEAELEARKFKADWCLKYPANPALTAALIEFGLIDDPDRLADLLYEEDDEPGEK